MGMMPPGVRRHTTQPASIFKWQSISLLLELAWQPRRLVASRPPEMSVSMMPSQLSGFSLGGAELPPNVTLVSMTGPCREQQHRMAVAGRPASCFGLLLYNCDLSRLQDLYTDCRRQHRAAS